MPAYSESLERLLKALARLPGLGARSSERILFHLLKASREEVEELATAIQEAKREARFCKVCGNFAERELCVICENPSRDARVICVVEDPKDVARLERTGRFNGVYHVLLGALSPLDDIGPKELRVNELFKRVERTSAREVILATNSNSEGEATAFYLAEVLKRKGVKTTRIARGIPMGGSLEFADEATLERALEDRQAI